MINCKVANNEQWSSSIYSHIFDFKKVWRHMLWFVWLHSIDERRYYATKQTTTYDVTPYDGRWPHISKNIILSLVLPQLQLLVDYYKCIIQ